MHSCQLLIVTVGFQDGDQGLVYLIHCLIEPTLGWGCSMSGFPTPSLVLSFLEQPSPLCSYLPSKAPSCIASSRKLILTTSPPLPTSDGALASPLGPYRPLCSLHHVHCGPGTVYICTSPMFLHWWEEVLVVSPRFLRREAEP